MRSVDLAHDGFALVGPAGLQADGDEFAKQSRRCFGSRRIAVELHERRGGGACLAPLQLDGARHDRRINRGIRERELL